MAGVVGGVMGEWEVGGGVLCWSETEALYTWGLGRCWVVHTLFYTTGIAASAKLHPNVGPYYR